MSCPVNRVMMPHTWNELCAAFNTSALEAGEAMDSLKDAHREPTDVISLTFFCEYMEGHSLAKIAAKHNVSPSRVSQRVHRIYYMFRRELAERKKRSATNEKG